MAWWFKSTYSCKGPGFDSLHPNGSQLSIIPIPGNPTPYSDFLGHQECMWHTDIHASKTYIFILNKKKITDLPQWINGAYAKPDDPHLTSKFHTDGKENQLLQVVL